MSTNNYKVSIIMPTYKRSDYLERAINSVLNQSYTNIEIVVVDDNDSNSEYRTKTEAMMAKYESNEKVVYVKNTKNIGGALARNEGIKRSTGEFITFLDDDDIYLTDKIKVQVDFMLKNNYELSFTDVRFNDVNNRLVDYREHKYVTDFSSEELLKQHIMHHLTPTATYMFRRDKILLIGGFDDVKMGQEFMLMLKAIKSNLKIGYLPVAYVIQYLHDGERISVGQTKLEKEIELFDFKKRYFPNLSLKQRRYVKFRHHAVMAVVGMRSGSIKVAITNIFLAFFTSPLNCFKELLNHFSKLRRKKSFIFE